MKTVLRIAIIFLFGLFILFIMIGILISFVIEYLVPLLGIDRHAESIEISLVISSFIIFCLILGLFIAKPMFIIQQWIKQLANGVYEQPKAARKNHLLSIYKGPFEDMNTLTNKLLENKEEFERIEQLKKEWMAGITHDMKTPLSYIVGYSKMYLSEDHDWTSEEKRSFIEEIEDKSEYMKNLLDDLNFAFQMEQHEPDMSFEQKDIVLFTRRILADAASHPRFQKHITALEVTEESILVPIDENLLGRAFFNIIINALIHNPEGTNITVHIYKDVHSVVIKIKDNGIGMDETTQQHLFNRYYRGTNTEAIQEGTGLGMAIARQIIEAHNGGIQLVSEVGIGTTVHLILPLDR
ncbi:ATP-binding protein [Metabacillus fastidiosus]|uniref:sensor histidine kinase n=1 Tax=Metabacillus fastidiosus TaxID=1458 RepID=UPI003D288D54